MPIRRTGLKYEYEHVSGDTDHLKGNLLQKVTCTIDCVCETFIQANSSEQLQFLDPSYQTSDYLTDVNGSRFSDFNIGDEIVISNANTGSNDGSYLISEKINDGTVRLTDTGGGAITLTTDLDSVAKINLVQDPLGISYDFGIVENANTNSFNSLIDGQLQRYRYDQATPFTTSTVYNQVANGLPSWQYGSSTVEKTAVDLTNYTYSFQIVHVFYIIPPYLDNQLLSLQNYQPPSYFDLFNCLKHNIRVRAYRDFQDPNIYQELIIDTVNGDTGWFNENFNGNSPEFTKANLVYSTSTNAIDSIVTTSFSFDLLDSGTAIEFVKLHFVLLPEQDSDYKNINSPLIDNYCLDSADMVKAGGAVNGFRFGGGFQVFTAVSTTAISGGVTVSGTIDFGADVLAKINAYSNKNYYLAAEVVSASQAANSSNYVTVLVDFNSVQIDVPNNLLTHSTKFLPHDVNDIDGNGLSPTNSALTRELTASVLIGLDKSVYTDAQIEKVELQVIATDRIETAILQNQEFDLSGNQIIGAVRFINQTIATPYNVAPSEIRAQIKAYRQTSSDSGDTYYYRFQYPFLLRWEYWAALNLASNPAAFLNSAQDFNGYNNQWERLGDLSGWDIKFRVKTTVSLRSLIAVKNQDYDISVNGFLENSNWINESIKIFDGATDLIVSGQPYFKTGKFYKVVCSFEWDGVGVPTLSDWYIVARMIPKEQGGFVSNNSFSSVYDRESVSFLTSNDGVSTGNGKISMAISGNTITGTFYIDPVKFNQSAFNEHTIYASINPVTVELDLGYLFEDSEPFLFEDGTAYDFEN